MSLFLCVKWVIVLDSYNIDSSYEEENSYPIMYFAFD